MCSIIFFIASVLQVPFYFCSAMKRKIIEVKLEEKEELVP